MIPILSRTYDPATFGAFQIAASLAMMIQPLATLRTEFILPSVTHDENARGLYIRGVLMVLAVAAVTTLAAAILALSSGMQPAQIAAMCALQTTALAITVLDNARLIRAGSETRLAIRNGLAGALTAVLQLVCASLTLDIWLLAVSVLAGRGLAILLTSIGSPRWNRNDVGDESRGYGIRRITPSVLAGVAASATGQTLTVTSGMTLGPSASGYVGVSQRIAGAPITLVGQSLSQLTQSRSSALIRASRPGLGRQVRRQMLVLSGISASVALVLTVLAPPLAVPILGKGWEAAGIVTAVLAFPISFQLLVGPLMPLLPMLGRERRLLSLQLTRLGLVLAAVVIARVLDADLLGTTVCFGAATLLGYLYTVVVLIVEADRYDRQHPQELDGNN
ncbi:lipopolysaccharide biosynthesis protein [Microbacterium sp. USHLN272]|uniref:lipopolysaccharide biosynthesis protein n=1 Tax=Microbacterium sp. USHLN272 TaxID=3081287 RepID=UPI0030188A2A